MADFDDIGASHDPVLAMFEIEEIDSVQSITLDENITDSNDNVNDNDNDNDNFQIGMGIT